MTDLRIDADELAGVVVATPVGWLDLSTYPSLRDGLLKLATGSPEALIVRLGAGFGTASQAMLSVFTTVWMKISQWPDVPLMLVPETERHRDELKSCGITKYVATAPDVASALERAERPPPRRFRRMPLPNSSAAPLMARALVRAVCAEWELTALSDDAVLVVSELVENAVRHARSESMLRVELRPGGLSIAVRDDDPVPAVQAPSRPAEGRHRGLEFVGKVSRVWGCTPSFDGGKVVWAVIDLPGNR